MLKNLTFHGNEWVFGGISSTVRSKKSSSFLSPQTASFGFQWHYSPSHFGRKGPILMNLSFNSHPLSSPLSYPAHGFPLTSPWWMIGLATGWTITHGNWLWRGLADSTSFTSRLMAASALHLEDSWVTRAKNSSRFTKRWMNESEFGSQITHRARMVLLNLFTTVTEV